MFGNINITETLTRAGGLVAGGIAASMVNNKLVPMVLKENNSPMLSNGITLAAGVLLPELIGKKGKGKKAKPSPIIQAIGDGMVASAGMNLAASFAPNLVAGIAGVGYSPELSHYAPEYLISGFEEEYAEAVAGLDSDYAEAVAGYEEEEYLEDYA